VNNETEIQNFQTGCIQEDPHQATLTKPSKVKTQRILRAMREKRQDYQLIFQEKTCGPEGSRMIYS
jgi:hypothetical protein